MSRLPSFMSLLLDILTSQPWGHTSRSSFCPTSINFQLLDTNYLHKTRSDSICYRIIPSINSRMSYQDSNSQADIALQPLTTRPAPPHKGQNASLLQVDVNEIGNFMSLDGTLDEDRNSSESDENRPKIKLKPKMQKALRFQGPANSSNTQGYVYATPLRELKNNSEFVDCTFCGVREATRYEVPSFRVTSSGYGSGVGI